MALSKQIKARRHLNWVKRTVSSVIRSGLKDCKKTSPVVFCTREQDRVYRAGVMSWCVHLEGLSKPVSFHLPIEYLTNVTRMQVHYQMTLLSLELAECVRELRLNKYEVSNAN